MAYPTEQGRQSLLDVVAWLRAGAPHTTKGFGVHHFDMAFGVDSNSLNTNKCGTVCCIAGAVCQFEKLYDGSGNLNFFGARGAGELARKHLGMTEEDAHKLFMPFDYFNSEHTANISPDVAADVVENYLRTGEVVWPFGEPQPQ